MKLLIRLVLAVVATVMLSCTGDIPAPPDPIRDFAVADSENIWIVTRDSDVFHRSGSEVEKIKLKARQVFFLNSFEGWLLGKTVRPVNNRRRGEVAAARNDRL
ncbi:MAG: hypothetical protein IPK58_08525 [Acidobacteria bacterium]|nr:hypothetical protein [Acidobacteriota bacterium]